MGPWLVKEGVKLASLLLLLIPGPQQGTGRVGAMEVIVAAAGYSPSSAFGLNPAINDVSHSDLGAKNRRTEKPSFGGLLDGRTLKKMGRRSVKSRQRRATLVWPDDSTFTAEFYFTIPIPAPMGVEIPVTLDVPYEFDLPNITSDYLGRQSNRRDERVNVYGVVEGLFKRFGMDGKSCVLRAVCERAHTNLEGVGIMGEVIGMILAASAASSYAGLYEYIQAEEHGRTEGECWAAYPSCPISLFHWLE